jgi:hypothetical protein
MVLSQFVRECRFSLRFSLPCFAVFDSNVSFPTGGVVLLSFRRMEMIAITMSVISRMPSRYDGVNLNLLFRALGDNYRISQRVSAHCHSIPKSGVELCWLWWEMSKRSSAWRQYLLWSLRFEQRKKGYHYFDGSYWSELAFSNFFTVWLDFEPLFNCSLRQETTVYIQNLFFSNFGREIA